MNNTRGDSDYQTRLAILFALTAGIIFWGLGSIPLMSLNEARRAIPISGMFQTGNWLLPYLNGELYIDKPPLFYWASLLFACVAGTINEWIFRLPSALAASAIMFATFMVCRRTFDKWQALFAVLVLATCTNFVIFARRGEIEMLLTALCSGSLFCAHEFIVGNGKLRTLYCSYLLMGAALLCKGPVALLFVHLPVLLMTWQQPRARVFIGHPLGWLLMLAVGLSWYGVVTQQLGMDVWQRVFQADISQKIAGHTNRDPLYSYALYVLADFMPWVLLLLLAPMKTWRNWRSNPSRMFFLYGALVPFIVLSLFANKHAKYLLPAYPAMAILVSARLAEFFNEGSRKIRLAFTSMVLLLLTGYLVFFAALESKIFNYRFSAMQDIHQLAQQYPATTVYGFQEVDMRTVYYLGKPVKLAAPKELAASASNDEPAFLLLEKDKWLTLIDTSHWHEVLRLTPYTSKDQTAVVLGNDAFIKQQRKP
ncbi:MAG TPA: glycosyltransferase family 39 protein [Pseudomonadales bacterium]|nr:glycosyltransferase family 39 protein [Pseudomonadales bacterium]